MSINTFKKNVNSELQLYKSGHYKHTFSPTAIPNYTFQTLVTVDVSNLSLIDLFVYISPFPKFQLADVTDGTNFLTLMADWKIVNGQLLLGYSTEDVGLTPNASYTLEFIYFVFTH